MDPNTRGRQALKTPLGASEEWFAQHSASSNRYALVHKGSIDRKAEALQSRRDLLFEQGEAYKRTRVVAMAREIAYDRAMAECRRLGFYTPPTLRGGRLIPGRYEWQLFYEEPEEYGDLS